MATNEISNFIQKGGLEDFTLYSGFKIGYRNREDKTMLPPGVLIGGSQNVLTNTYQRVGVRKGYVLDGASDTTITTQGGSYDWEMRAGDRNLRSGGLTTAGNDGKLQYRYVDADGVVTWRDLMTGLTSVDFNFTTFWDFSSEKKDFLLFVDGSSNIYEWSGGVSTVLSATATTLTIDTDTSVAEENFYNLTPWGSFVAAGVDYAYTGVTGSTFTGVTPDPSAIPAGTIIHQKVKTTANSSMAAIPATFPNDLISTLRNQVYIGCKTDNTVYISEQNNYKDFSFTSPVRVVGEGALVTLDAAPQAFAPQEERMYVSAGTGQWYETRFTLSADLEGESFEIIRLKTSVREGAQSQALTSKMDNNVIFVSNIPVVNSLGRVDNVVLTPQFQDLSFPIVNDMNAYDFTDGNIVYFKKYIYISAPREGIVLIYNVTNPDNPYWEAPQTLPVGRFAIIDGELYGHAYSNLETYKLFVGYNDNGLPINARARLSYMNYGSRSNSKSFNLWYSEGYMQPNTTLTLGLSFEVDGCQRNFTFDLDGSNRQFVCSPLEDNSLGKYPLGTQPLGGIIDPRSNDQTPPKFRWIRSFNMQYFYEHSVDYSSYGVDQQWEILAFGPQITSAADQNTHITE